MPHPIEDKLADLRRRVRVLAAIYGLSAIVGIVLAVFILLGSIDYLLRFQDRGLRIFVSLALFGASGWAFYRYLYLPGGVYFRNVDLALKLQRRFPGLEDRLLSAVEFIAQDEDDPTAGSPALRRWVIARTAAETEQIDFKQAVDPRPVVRIALLSILICSAAVMLAVFEPGASQTAVARLVNPLGNAVWPQKNHLAIRDPVKRVGRGQAFEVEAVDSQGARLPDAVYIHYRFTGADGSTMDETALMPQVGGAAVARRENVVRAFSYRVEGGDDRSMPWQSVEVVDPPGIRSLSIRLFPPSYTGWPPEKAENNIRSLAGTHLEIRAKATNPLKSAELLLEDGSEFTGQISADGLQITFDDAALVVEKSGSYWFHLVDGDGLTGGENDRWEIIAAQDAPPSITIEQPTTNLYVTPQAVVPVRISVKDDLAIREIDLAFKQIPSDKKDAAADLQSVPGLSGSEDGTVGQANRGAPEIQETVVPLYTGPRRLSGQTLGGFSQSVPSGQSQVVDYRWELEPLRLAPGMQVTFQAVASDYLPQTARSEPRRLFLVTPAELQDRIAGRQKLLLSELDRALKMQRGVKSQVEAIQIRLSEIKRPEQSELDRLRAAELGQRQVNVVLTSRGEGVPSHIYAMLADLENNRIDNPDLKRSLDLILEEINRLDRDKLPIIGREMTSAVKSAEIALSGSKTPAGDDRDVISALAAAGKNQNEVIASLEKLITQLTQWDSSRRFERELDQLIRQQEDTAGRSAELGRRTLTRQLRDLSPQDAAELKILASRQFDHGRLLDRILHDMRDSVAAMQQTDPLGAKIMNVALDQADRMGIGGQMRACGDSLRQNQIGQAAELQKSILEDLRQILDILIHQSTRPSTADELARLENFIKDLRTRQENIRDDTHRMDRQRQSPSGMSRIQLAAILDLARAQRSLQVDTIHLGDQLGSAAVFALAIDSASRDMDRAAGLLDRRTTGMETQQAQQSAITRLNQLLEVLKPEPPQDQQNAASNAGNKSPGAANQTPPQQGIATLAELKLLKMLQENINRRTAVLAEAVGSDGKPTDQQRREYENLADEQARLAELILRMMNPK